MCLIKNEAFKSSLDWDYYVWFFCHFPHLTKEIERCAQSKLNCLELPMAFKPSLNWNKNYFLCAFFAIAFALGAFNLQPLFYTFLEKWFCKLGFFFLLNHFSHT